MSSRREQELPKLPYDGEPMYNLGGSAAVSRFGG